MTETFITLIGYTKDHPIHPDSIYVYGSNKDTHYEQEMDQKMVFRINTSKTIRKILEEIEEKINEKTMIRPNAQDFLKNKYYGGQKLDDDPFWKDTERCIGYLNKYSEKDFCSIYHMLNRFLISS